MFSFFYETINFTVNSTYIIKPQNVREYIKNRHWNVSVKLKQPYDKNFFVAFREKYL